MARLLDTLTQRNLWVSSIANAIGLTAKQVTDIIRGYTQPNDAVRHNLAKVLGGSWEGDISSKDEEIPAELLRQAIVMSGQGVELPKGARTEVAIKAWLDQCQIFALDALIDALHHHGYSRAWRGNLGRFLNRFGYYSKREWVMSHQRQCMVWRFNPFRFDMEPHEDTRPGVLTYEDAKDMDPRYVKNQDWRTNVVHFLVDHEKFTLHAIARTLGVVDHSALRQQLRLRGYRQVNSVWMPKAVAAQVTGSTVKDTRERIQPTGYVLTKIDERGEVVLLPGKKYELFELALSGHVQPRVFRSERRALASNPGHVAKKWTRVHGGVNERSQPVAAPTEIQNLAMAHE